MGPPPKEARGEPAYSDDNATLLLGDCLDLLPSVDAESVDLVYLDPPFFTQRTHTAFDKTGKAHSFEDRFPGIGAYIDWVRVRVEEMHRALKPTGSLYLHCDDHASAYLKLMLDEVFGIENFRNDIKWKRTSAHSVVGRSFGRVHDNILYYGKTEEADLKPTPEDVGDLWLDMPGPPPTKERVGYPTQKPLALLERIVKASSWPGDLVLDPFSGSGTTLVAAVRLGRRAIGMDQSEGACEVASRRLDKLAGQAQQESLFVA